MGEEEGRGLSLLSCLLCTSSQDTQKDVLKARRGPAPGKLCFANGIAAEGQEEPFLLPGVRVAPASGHRSPHLSLPCPGHFHPQSPPGDHNLDFHF